jgi:hypothetical protein
MTESTGSPSEALARLNRELAELFGRPPVALQHGASLRSRDELVVCAVLAGKDAGKSTLINALAGAEISVAREVVGRGTYQPIAYVHREATDALHRRFAPSDAGHLACHPVTHDVPMLRKLVLLDLPDIDSVFHEHLETVARAVECVDRVVWVFDPKKGDDRALSDIRPSVARDPASVFCVLNKLDLTLRDEVNGDNANRFWLRINEWFEQCLRAVGLPVAGDHRFALAARFVAAPEFAASVTESWTGSRTGTLTDAERAFLRDVARQAEAEFDRLRNSLLAPLDPEEIRRLKQDNETAELAANLDTLRAHYDLDGALHQLATLLADVSTACDREFDGDYRSTVSRRLARVGRSDVDLAREVMARRVERWSVLPVLYWPLRGVTHWLGSRLAGGGAGRNVPPAADLLRVRGWSVAHRVESVHTQAQTALRRLPEPMAGQICWPSTVSLTAGLEGRVCERLENADEDILASCLAGLPRPGILSRGFVWFVLIWFPLLQPLLRAGLELLTKGAVVGGLAAGLTVVTALGAGGLMKGFGAALAVMLFMLAVLYARSVRLVQRVRREAGVGPSAGDVEAPSLSDIDAMVDEEILRPLAEPVQELANRVELYRQRLAALEDGGR